MIVEVELSPPHDVYCTSAIASQEEADVPLLLAGAVPAIGDYALMFLPAVDSCSVRVIEHSCSVDLAGTYQD